MQHGTQLARMPKACAVKKGCVRVAGTARRHYLRPRPYLIYADNCRKNMPLGGNLSGGFHMIYLASEALTSSPILFKNKVPMPA